MSQYRHLLNNIKVVTPKYFDVYSDLSIIDSPLSTIGLNQCKRASKLSNLIDVDYVFVSPLRRALETAHNMFKDHPKFDRITFYVHPTFRENIMTAGDIPEDINLVVNQYVKLIPNLSLIYFPRLECGRLDSLYYARDFIPELAKQIEGLSKPEADLIICDAISKRFPKSIEAFYYTKSRVETMKDFLQKFMIKKNINPQSKIAIVGHSYFFKLWTGLWYDETLTLRKQPNEYVWLENCELFPDIFNFPLAEQNNSF